MFCHVAPHCSLQVNGAMTLGEAMADEVGLKFSYLVSTLQNKGLKMLNELIIK